MPIGFSECDKCRICGSSEAETILKFDRMPILAEPLKPGESAPTGPLTVQQCAECGYVYLKEIIDCAIYNDYIYTPQTSSDVVQYLKEFVAKTAAEIGLQEGQLGLEVGSGDGSLCREFNELGMHFVGIEPSKSLAKISREINRVETHNAFLCPELVAGLEKKFDVVVIRHVMEHIDRFEPFIEALNSCLKPDGTLIIEVPYLGDIANEKQFYAFFFEHLSYFSVTSLHNLLKKFGFFIEKVEFVHPEGGSVLVRATRKCVPAPQERSDFDDNSLKRLKEDFEFFRQSFRKLIEDTGPIAAYGAGQRGITLLNLLNASPAEVVAIFDENPTYHGLITPQSGIVVKSPREMTLQSVPGKVLILASSYERQIRAKYQYMEDRFVSLSTLTDQTF